MRLFVVSDVPGPSDTEQVDCGREQKPLSQVITFIEPQTVYENMYPTIQAWERAAVNNTSAFFSISATHQKMGARQNTGASPRTSQQFLALWLFVFAVIKNNNGALSPPLAGSQAGTIRGRLIGRAGWGICWRRHGR